MEGANSRTLVTKQITKMLLVISAAVCCAFAVIAVMVYNHGMEKTYDAAQLLPSPAWMGSALFEDSAQPSFSLSEGVFVATTDAFTGLRQALPMSAQLYGDFYNMAVDAESYREPPKQAVDSFAQGPALSLVLNIHSPDTFMREVQFARYGGYFRIDLSNSLEGSRYAYFYSKTASDFVQKGMEAWRN